MVSYQQCSTPFGITEVGGEFSRTRVADARDVLNAFRHHRGGRLQASIDLVNKSVCSTPFGITEVGGPGWKRLNVVSIVCSTPFGITEVGGPLCVADPVPC